MCLQKKICDAFNSQYKECYLLTIEWENDFNCNTLSVFDDYLSRREWENFELGKEEKKKSLLMEF